MQISISSPSNTEATSKESQGLPNTCQERDKQPPNISRRLILGQGRKRPSSESDPSGFVRRCQEVVPFPLCCTPKACISASPRAPLPIRAHPHGWPGVSRGPWLSLHHLPEAPRSPPTDIPQGRAGRATKGSNTHSLCPQTQHILTPTTS